MNGNYPPQAGSQPQQPCCVQIVGQRPQPSLGEAFKLFFQNYVNFSGRSRRSEYWKVFLVNILINIASFLLVLILGAVIGVASSGHGSGSGLMGGLAGAGIIGIIVYALLGIYSLICLIPSLSLLIRRLHDVGMSGWWALLLIAMIIPILNFLVAIALLVLFCIDGKPETNKWGASPKYIVQ